MNIVDTSSIAMNSAWKMPRADVPSNQAGMSFKQQLREAAAQLVSSAFLVPMLNQLRESPLAATGPFAPSSVEKRFGPLLDQHIADEVITSSKLSLVDAIVSRLSPPDTHDNSTTHTAPSTFNQSSETSSASQP